MIRPWKGHIHCLFCMSDIAHHINLILLYLMQRIHYYFSLSLLFDLIITLFWMKKMHLLLDTSHYYHVFMILCTCAKKSGNYKNRKTVDKNFLILSAKQCKLPKLTIILCHREALAEQKKKETEQSKSNSGFCEKRPNVIFFRHLSLKKAQEEEKKTTLDNTSCKLNI